MAIHRVEGFVPPNDGELVAVDAGGTRVAVASVDGTLLAVDDTCTHMQCSLSEGEVEGGSVVCPCHFGQFDLRTGRVLDGPPPAPIGVWRASLSDGVLELEQ